MTTTTRLRAACLLAAVTTVTGLAGCGASGDTKAACTKVQNEIAQFNAGSMKNINDPAAMKTDYDNFAARIRADAKGTDIEAEAGAVATSFEKLAQQVADFSANPSTTMPNLNSADVIAAGTALKKKCT